MSLSKKKYRIAGLGEVLWDIFPEEKKIGGAPANFTAHAQQLGAQSFILSSIGNDALGLEAQRLLRQADVDTRGLVVNSDFPTGWVEVFLDDQGNADYKIHDNAAWDYIPFDGTAKKIANQLDAVCFGTLAQRNSVSQNSIFKILEETPKDCLRVFDVNFRKDFFNPQMVEQSLNYANILKMNEHEFDAINEMFSIPKNLKKGMFSLIDRFDLKMCILTLGKKGSIMAGNNYFSHQTEIPSIRIKSTVGAGDAFTAAAVMGWLNQKPLDQINREASDIAAWICTQLEAVPKLNTKK
jgi:fructokinase